MGLVGCYSLDLYCDKNKSAAHQFTMPRQYAGRTEAECIRRARRDGWSINKRIEVPNSATQGRTICGTCNATRRKADPK